MHQFTFKQNQSQTEDWESNPSPIQLQMYCCNTANVLLVIKTP